MKSVHRVSRASTLLLSATLVGIAVELPLPTTQVVVPGFNSGGLPIKFRGFLSVADVNGDGLDDIVAPKAIYLQAANGSFAANPAAGLVGYSADVRIAIPDVTGDGAADFLVQTEFFDLQTQQTMCQVELHAGDPATGLPEPRIRASFSDATSGLAPITPQVLDLDRNNFKDVAFVFSTAVSGPAVLAFMGLGGGSFALTPTNLTGYVSIPQLAITLDQGREKLAVGSGNPGQLRLFTVSGLLPSSTTVQTPQFPIQHLTSGKRSASGDPHGSLVMQSGQSLQEASASATVFEVGFPSSTLAGAFWIVPDLTGDGLDDFVGRVTTNVGQSQIITCGVLPTVAGSTQPNMAVERPFFEPLTTIELANGTLNPQFVPYAVGTGTDLAGNVLPHRLILAPIIGPDLLGLPSIAPTLVIGGGATSTPVALVYSAASSPIQLFPAQVALTFGDAASEVTRLSVTLTSPTADDQVFFSLPAGLSLQPTLTTSTTGANSNRVYTFTEAASVSAYQSLLASLVYQSSAAPAGTATLLVNDFAGRARSTSASSAYGMPAVQLASLTFNGLPTTTIPLLTNAAGHADSGFTSNTVGANTPNFTLVVFQQGLKGTGSIDATGQFFNYDRTNLQAIGTDEVILSVFDEVTPPPQFGARGVRAQQEIGRIRILITLAPVALSLSVIAGSTSMALGESVVIQVSQGIAPYQISANRPTILLPVSPQVGAARGAVTSSQGFYLKPQELGDTVITVRDVNGTSTQLTLTTSLLASVEVPHPSVPASVGDKTVFGAICPGTPQGVSSLLAGLGRVDARQARGFTWDAATQRYVELPAQPGDGIGPTTGVFLAARADLGLNFSGAQLPLGAEIILQPGWNFVGLGPVLDNGVTRTSHQLVSDFQLILVDAQSSVAARDQIGDVAYLWNGSTYEQTTTLQSNVGYWINNRRADGKALSLRRVANGTGFSARAEASADDVRLNEVGQPPTPPAASASNQDEGGGGCGSGSGIALVLGSLLAFARFMRFRR